MSIREELKTVGIAAAVLLLSAGPAGAVVVVGTGDPAIDVPAVQAAADQGGTVTLSGTFDFGTHSGNHIIVPGRVGSDQDVRGQSTVFIHQADVTVVGETDQGGNPITVIRNGMPPFWVGWDGNVLREQPPGTPNVDYGIETLPQDSLGNVRYQDGHQDPGYSGPQTRYAIPFPQVSATIEHIYFDSPLHGAVKGTVGQNLTVSDNVVQDLQWGGLVHANGFSDAARFAFAISAASSFWAPFVVPAFTGSVTIAGNRVETVGTQVVDTHNGECFGLDAELTTCPVTITDNEVRNVGRNPDGTGPVIVRAASICVMDNFTGAVVRGNTIQNCWGIGIWDLKAVAASPAVPVTGNRVLDCPTGIKNETWGPQSTCDVQGNVTSDCLTGLDLGTHRGSAAGNLVWGCQRGLFFRSAGTFGADRNTIVECTGNGIEFQASATVTSLAANLVVDNGAGIRVPTGTNPSVVLCNDAWNNAGGNWFGIPDPSGTNGNFSMDPLFCNLPMHDYWLAPGSPCLPGNHPQGVDCGTIGALGGCEGSAVREDGPARRANPVARLLGPWPNPSRRVLRFGILLTDPTSVQIRLFSVTGRALATLVDRELPSGYHNLSWNIANPGGSVLPGGLYYLQMASGGQTQTRKIVVAR